MAEEIKKVVSVDVSKAVEDIKALSDELEEMGGDILDNIKTFKDYKNVIERLSVSLSKMDEDTDEYEKTLTDLNKVQNAYNDALSVSKKKTDDAAGSYNALSKEMSELKKAFKATNDESERQKIGEKIVGINDRLKEMDASIGNYQRNVGNYSSAFTDGLDKIGEKFAALNDPVGLAKKAVLALSGAFKALLANPVGAVIAAIVVAVKGLVNAFRQNEEATNKLRVAYSKVEPIVNAFKTVMGNIVNVIGDVIVRISKLAENVLSSWSKIGGVLKVVLSVFSPVVDGIKWGFTAISDEVEKFVGIYTSAIDWIGKGSVKIAEWLNKIGIVSDEKLRQMRDVINAEKTIFETSTEYTERQIALEQRKRKEEEETARKESEISKLKFQAVQRDKYSAEERQKFLQEAIDLEKEINNERLAIAKEELDIEEWKAAQAPNSAEDNERLARVRANYYRVEKEYTERSKEIYGRLIAAQNQVKDSSDDMVDALTLSTKALEDGLKDIDKSIEEQDKAFEKEQEDREKRRKEISQKVQDRDTNPQQLELQKLKEQYKQEYEALEGYEYDQLLLTQQYEADKAAIIDKYRQEKEQKDQEARDKEKAAKIAEIEELAEKREKLIEYANDAGTILGSISDAWSSLLERQLQTGRISEKEYKRRQKSLQAFQIASIVAQTAASLADLWVGYGKETAIVNTQTAAATGPAAAATKAALDAKSLVGTIAKTVAVSAQAATQIASIKSGSLSSASGMSGGNAASISSNATGYVPSYSQTTMSRSDITSLQNAVSQGTQEGTQNVKVYVLAQEITEKQNEIKTAVTESTF